jgi:hypothetical protein
LREVTTVARSTGPALVTVNDMLDGNTVLDVSCLDRLYLSGFVQSLQTPGGVVYFLREHRGMPIASPAVFEQIGGRFRDGMRHYAEANHIPVVRLRRDDRKIEVMRPYLDRAAKTGRSQVAAIGVAQEFQVVWTARKRDTDPTKAVQFSFTKEPRRVTVFYLYLWDDDFGSAFIKICSYFPYPIKVWVNGHEWAKRQATKAGIGFTALSNGFASCDDPAALQAICDRLGPGTIRVFFERWISRLPLPLTTADRDAGFWWDLTMRQVETSRTIVFDAPPHARAFFEALVADNLDLGRPDSVELIFKRNPGGRKAGGTFKTAIDRHTDGVTVNVFYKHSRAKQYLKDGRALRIETVINDAYDIGCLRLLPNLDDLQAKARAINQRLLDTERVGRGTVLASPAFERIAQPTVTDDGRRAPALRFGDPRVQALAGALANTLFAVTDITNKSLRALMTGLLGTDYSLNQASYDLARLRLNGLIVRVPDHHRYTLTIDGIQFAIFYTKVHDRVLRPLLAAATQPNAPPDLRAALRTINQAVDQRLTHARLPTPA